MEEGSFVVKSSSFRYGDGLEEEDFACFFSGFGGVRVRKEGRMDGWMDGDRFWVYEPFIYITLVCLSGTDSGGRCACPSLVMAELVLDS